MKLPAKIEYAYKAVLELALRYNGDSPIQLNSIAEAQGIPKKFLIQLLLRLKSAGIVNSERGVSGGYYLARLPSQITLEDVVKAIDENVIQAEVFSGRKKTTDSEKLLANIWSDMNRQAAGKLASQKFDKLVNLVKNEQLTYQI